MNTSAWAELIHQYGRHPLRIAHAIHEGRPSKNTHQFDEYFLFHFYFLTQVSNKLILYILRDPKTANRRMSLR